MSFTDSKEQSPPKWTVEEDTSSLQSSEDSFQEEVDFATTVLSINDGKTLRVVQPPKIKNNGPD